MGQALYRRGSILSLVSILALAAAPAARAQNVFSGVWAPGNDGHALWITSDWDGFTTQWDAYNKAGLRMDDFEVYMEGDLPVYVGSFRAGTGGHAAYIVADWNDFTVKWAEFEGQGLRMHDFETYVVGRTRWYAGIFREGTGGRAAYIVTDWSDFTRQWAVWGREGLRMHDFETYVEGGVRWYAGIFREGNDGHAAWFTSDWQDFNDKWVELEKQGLRLIDFEFWDEGGTPIYGGIFREGSGGRYGWFGVDWENFRSFWHERSDEGYRLVDIEVYPAACSNVCMNQLILPAPDFYDYGITRTATHCPGLSGTCAVPGNDVVYSAPFYEEGGARYVRFSAVNIEDQIFTLPFTDTDMKHNGWLYEPGSWHHAIDYYNGTNFQVRAAAPGTVIHVGWDWWSGNTVVVSHDVGAEKDKYRTIYMHLLNGAEADCTRSWTQTVPKLSDPELSNYKSYLADSDCNQDGSGVPDPNRWGTNADVIPVVPGQIVERGEVLGKADSMGPGGCGCVKGGKGPNHHLHIFFAHRDPTDDRWYFFDPYGIYGPTECYPTRDDAEGASPATPCARYPVAWLGGRPQLPTPPSITKSFKRSDANGDGFIDISDPVFVLACLFLGGRCPSCDDAADVNDDGELDISDAVASLNCQFLARCPDLTGACERDRSTGDRLSCRDYGPCEAR